MIDSPCPCGSKKAQQIHHDVVVMTTNYSSVVVVLFSYIAFVIGKTNPPAWLGCSPEEHQKLNYEETTNMHKKLNYEETTNMHVSSGLAHTLNVCRRLK